MTASSGGAAPESAVAAIVAKGAGCVGGARTTVATDAVICPHRPGHASIGADRLRGSERGPRWRRTRTRNILASTARDPCREWRGSTAGAGRRAPGVETQAEKYSVQKPGHTSSLAADSVGHLMRVWREGVMSSVERVPVRVHVRWAHSVCAGVPPPNRQVSQ
eukprot:scaffold37375_cov264-Isochrysis_galbana.AAC.2